MVDLLRRSTILLFLSGFLIDQVTCRGRGSFGKGIGDDIGDSISSLQFDDPTMTAAFAFIIIITLITFYQFCRAAILFKKPVLPAGEPPLNYDVGTLFPILRVSYLFVYLLWNIMYAIFIASIYTFNSTIFFQPSYVPGMWFVGQLSDVLFLSMLLSIIAYRERIQLKPGQSLFNLKSFLDGWLMSVIFILGIGLDAVFGATLGLLDDDSMDIPNLILAYAIFYFLGCIYVAGSAIMTNRRFHEHGIQDKIIRITTLFITPFILLTGVYHIIDGGLERALATNTTLDPEALILAEVVIFGLAAVMVAGLTLLMGAPPTPPVKSKGGGK